MHDSRENLFLEHISIQQQLLLLDNSMVALFKQYMYLFTTGTMEAELLYLQKLANLHNTSISVYEWQQ